MKTRLSARPARQVHTQLMPPHVPLATRPLLAAISVLIRVHVLPAWTSTSSTRPASYVSTVPLTATPVIMHLRAIPVTEAITRMGLLARSALFIAYSAPLPQLVPFVRKGTISTMRPFSLRIVSLALITAWIAYLVIVAFNA